MIICPKCSSPDIAVDEAPGVHDLLVTALKHAESLVESYGQHREAVDFLKETAEQALELMQKPHNKVICGDCGWMGETDDLSAD